MARTRRRTSRRTTTQRAAGLIALALPAPVQRVADTRLGSLLMLVGAPVLIMFGLLNVKMVDGFPTFTFNRTKAVELRNAASQHINNLENQAISQNWGQSTIDFLHAAQGANHDHQAPAFPSTRPQTSNSAYNNQQPAYPSQHQGQSPQYPTQQYSAQQYPTQQYPTQQYPTQQHPASYSQQQQYPATYQQPQYPGSSQQPYPQSYQQGSYSQAYQQQPYQAAVQQPYNSQPARTFQQPTQQWPTGYAQQPYQANTAAYGQGQPSAYPSQPNSYPTPAYQNQGQLGRY